MRTGEKGKGEKEKAPAPLPRSLGKRCCLLFRPEKGGGRESQSLSQGKLKGRPLPLRREKEKKGG